MHVNSGGMVKKKTKQENSYQEENIIRSDQDPEPVHSLEETLLH